MNVTDVHAGELYMLADDPGQDKNVYEDSQHSVMMRKMNHLPPVSFAVFCFFLSLKAQVILYAPKFVCMCCVSL